MTIANSFDLWKKDAFFSAAEEVQESADMHIVLITLATGPFIVAAGGISNIFLHRLAENIQDAYAEAASIAEQ
ncbi:hypothetical protein Gotur_023148, partial [Gossypium turneri]